MAIGSGPRLFRSHYCRVLRHAQYYRQRSTWMFSICDHVHGPGVAVQVDPGHFGGGRCVSLGLNGFAHGFFSLLLKHS